MIPLYISGCFCVLHPGQRRRGVVICGPLSDEALNSYRALAFLGEQLAAAQFSTLRLAYYGTGDSDGGDSGGGDPGGTGGAADRFGQWLASIRSAADWLHTQHGVEAVTLVGHRLGASLAARAACDCAIVDSLVLTSPTSGRQFLHELTLAARISQRVWQTTQAIDDGTWFESHGLRISRATREALTALDLRKLPGRPAAQALLLEQEGRSGVQAQAEALRRLGTATTMEACHGLDVMQRDSHAAEVPQAAFARITDWIQALPSADAATFATPTVAAVLHAGPACETPVRFGPDAALFGILAQPTWAPPNLPAVLVVNTSANPRWGNARIAVDVARSLAADGVASLRMDASGIGDAAPQTGEAGRPYSETVTQDVGHAVTELARRTQRPVVVLGICSGGYHALQAAYRDPTVGGLVLVNLQRFVWREGDPPDAVRRTDLRPTRFYLRNIASTQAWLRLLRADFDVANLVRVLVLRILRRILAAFDPVLNLVFRGATRVGRVRQAIAALGRWHVPILYVLGSNDPGVEELAAYFGSDGWRLRRQPNVTLRTLAGADHTLGAAAVRAVLIQEIRAWCHAQWSAGETPVPTAARDAEHSLPQREHSLSDREHGLPHREHSLSDRWTRAGSLLRPFAFWHRPIRG